MLLALAKATITVFTSCVAAPKKPTNDLFSKLLNVERMRDVRVGDSIDLVEIQAS